MADASDDEADAMASVRMLFVMFTKLRQLADNGIPDSCARVPRLPTALAEADRPFNQTYCNRHAKVFRDNYRVNHHVFDSLVEICDAQITEPARSKRELLGVTLDWVICPRSRRQVQDRLFNVPQVSYSWHEDNYRFSSAPH
ncbi:hypothetical protein PHYPSEUDO_012542 [Phytophthora pseudosyringae]|uniref:Uncharacterized protein n=1 Tax=Phytophthora pseudosyringae TaxID=221518 RepID=A0A8T1V6P2_9STRA|nr:hypothetical protein PHYPSEUDO_012542 [Phytophthora pseudosyringae]